MTTTQTRTGDPPSVTLEVVAWTLSARVWVWTAVLTAVVAVLIGLVGWFQFDAPPVATIVTAMTTPDSMLATFLSGRAVAFLHCQRHRDRAMAAGTKTLNSDVSLASVVTVASYTIVGLIATGVAMPIVYEVTGPFFYLAAGIAVVATPIGFLLLTYQLTELVAADRYRRGFRVLPAAWVYAVSLPWLVLVWLLVTERTALYPPVPPAIRNATSLIWGEYLTIDAWEIAYVGLCAPTALAFAYTIRRQFEAVFRRIFRL
ncbi:hypothetical protein SAMN06269185_0888 [Natronoarchaeum philippinense]|uniref:Uncharacterized protein n=1 Tax=Natronoarchaeum philippinense TaxID=558529 RepID=A0A285N899_NATPI|nr:hypothetical protein [Natronoarchaeum philippinense]SNZ05548.1 hypothetical protein SAMN06269185_0888 [Natronoarchaeum philippinense]